MADHVTILLLLTQSCMHLAIALRIALWNGAGGSFRPWVSRIAWLLAGSSASSAIYILTVLPSIADARVNPWNTVFIAIVLLAVLKSRGNLAFFLPRR
ncbi:MAG: phage holin family protein [Pseudomonas sp.]